MPTLENWSIVSRTANPYQAPELGAKCLNGNIYGDESKRFPDGHSITTSSVQTLDLENHTAKTKNTTYTLGKPNEDYLLWLSDHNMELKL